MRKGHAHIASKVSELCTHTEETQLPVVSLLPGKVKENKLQF